MEGLPRAAWTNPLESAPIVGTGIRNDSQIVPARSALSANGTTGAEIYGAGGLQFDELNQVWEFQRGTIRHKELLPREVRTAGISSTVQTNYNHVGAVLYWFVFTTNGGLILRFLNNRGGLSWILGTLDVNAPGSAFGAWTIYPGILEVAQTVPIPEFQKQSNLVLPGQFGIQILLNGATSYESSVEADYLL